MSRLIGDIGGTNARFALVAEDGEAREGKTLAVSDHPGLIEAALAYLAGHSVDEAVIAVATPVESDVIRFTNSPWVFSIAELRAALGVARLSVINDFVAQALAVPHLAAADLEPLLDAVAMPDRPIGVIGPGTGLGVAALVPQRGRWLPIATEGGHSSFAPGDDREIVLLQRLRDRYAHLSKERLVSGPGLLTLARTLAEIEGVELEAQTPARVVELAANGDSLCVEATRCFSGLLGSAAGDLALTYGARGGIYVAGGVCLAMGRMFDRALFRERFLAKGRMRTYLERIPAWLVLRGSTGLIGAARCSLETH